MNKNRKSKIKYKRFLSVLTVLCLTAGLVLLVSVPVYANTAIFGGGSGTAIDPWLINDIAELQAFRDSVNGINGHTATSYQGQFIRLNGNINLSGTGNWIPIGHGANVFQGTFNGGGHTISNMTVRVTDFNGSGFFGQTGNNATVENLGLINVDIRGFSFVGGIAGHNNGGIVQNSYVSSGNILQSGDGVGGIVGLNNNGGIVRNCYVNVEVSGSNNIGGIVGLNVGHISNTYAMGSVTAADTAGGIAGRNNPNGTISNSVAIQELLTTASSNVGRITGGNSGTLSANRAGIWTVYRNNSVFPPANDGGNTIDGWQFDRRTHNNANLTGNTWNTNIWLFTPSALFYNNPPTFQPVRTITYNGNGHTGGSTAFNTYRGTVTVPGAGNLERTGHTFNGWNTSADGNGTARAVSSTFTITADTTLFAQWIPYNYTVRFNPNGGEGVMTDQNFTYGTAQGLTANTFTKQGYQFTSWNTASDGSGTPFTDGQSVENLTSENNGTVNLYAQWGIPPFVGKVDVQDETEDFTVNGSNLEEVFKQPVTDGNKGVTAEEMQEGNTVLLTLTVSETDDSAAGAEPIIERTRGRLLQFFDITVTKTVNNNDPVTLTELPVPIQITIDLSEELSGRTGYTVYRYHGNQVQLIGMDTDADEYFTVSRGTGEEDVDQVIINTRRFSTYAVVENILMIDGLGSDDVDVQARIVDLTASVYMIDIAWGDMKFIYHTAYYTGDWNPDNKTYENPVAVGWSGFDDTNNQIIVTNHSNADVLVDFDITDNFDAAGTVTMTIESEHAGIAKVPLPGANALNIEAFLLIAGTPSPADITRLTNDIWHKIGIITVTITPDGDVLTPLL